MKCKGIPVDNSEREECELAIVFENWNLTVGQSVVVS